MESHERRTPCGNCPFRKDARLAYWHPEMYTMLADIEKTEGDFLKSRVFGCHKDKNGPKQEYCVGWLINQRERDVPNIKLRLGLMVGKHSSAALEQFEQAEPGDGVELYETVSELVEVNISADMILNPHRYKGEV